MSARKIFIFTTLLVSILNPTASRIWVKSAFAGDQATIVVMGEDADEDTIPRHNRIFNRVSDALKARMIEMGFKTFNETAITMDITNPGRVRRTDAELVSVAKSITDTPIDVIIPFQIYASPQGDNYSDIKKLQIRISGRLLQIATGRELGNFEVSVGPKGIRPLPSNCNSDCVLERVGDEAKIVANEVGSVLAKKLDELSPIQKKSEGSPSTTSSPSTINTKPVLADTKKEVEKSSDVKCSGLSTAYTVVLDGFDSSDIEIIEQTMIALQGYEHHRALNSRTKHSEYWYETCSDRSRLERNFRTLASQMPGQVRLELSGNKLVLEKVPGAPKR